MEENNKKQVLLPTILLAIALIVIVVMGVYIYKLRNDKIEEFQKAFSSQTDKIIDLDKANTEATEDMANQMFGGIVQSTTTNNEASNSNANNSETKEINDIYSQMRKDSENNVKREYKSKEEILAELDKNVGNKYALVNINQDSYDDLLIYKKENMINFSLTVYAGSKDGFYLVNKPLTDAHESHNNILKEEGKPYLTLVFGHMGDEHIDHFYILENGYATKRILDHETKEDYESSKLSGEISWTEIK